MIKQFLLVAFAACLCMGVAAQAHAQNENAAAAADEHHDDHGHDTHGAHGHGIGHAGVSEDPTEVSPDLAVYTFIIFLLLLGVLWKFAWGPIAAALDKREQKIADHIAAAEKSHEDAKLLLAEYERKLAAAHDETRAIVEEARRDAEHTQQEIIAKARQEAQAEVERARREIDTAKAQALREVAERGADMALNLAGRIVQSQLNANDHARLIEEALAKIPDTVPSRN